MYKINKMKQCRTEKTGLTIFQSSYPIQQMQGKWIPTQVYINGPHSSLDVVAQRKIPLLHTHCQWTILTCDYKHTTVIKELHKIEKLF
jgi:hypothetical protein